MNSKIQSKTCPRDCLGVGVKQVSHSNNIGSFTQTSPWCLLAASMYLLPAGFAALMVLLSSEVSFFLLLEGFFAVVASIILVVYTFTAAKIRFSEQKTKIFLGFFEREYLRGKASELRFSENKTKKFFLFFAEREDFFSTLYLQFTP